MSYDHDRRDDGAGGGRAGREPAAPGKRALTDSMPRRSQAAGPDAGLGRPRAPRSMDDALGDYAESRTTIDGPAPEDPLSFLDEERARHRGGKGKRRRDAGRDPDGDGDAEAPAAPRKLRGEITNVMPNDDDGDQDRTSLTVGVGAKHGVTGDATFQLLRSGGQPHPGGALTIKEVRGVTTLVGSRLPGDKVVDQVAGGSKVLVTIPAAKEPELNPDGSIGDDMRAFEA